MFIVIFCLDDMAFDYATKQKGMLEKERIFSVILPSVTVLALWNCKLLMMPFL